MTTNLHPTAAYGLGEEITVSVGQSAQVDDRWYIRFEKVVEDSRCPMNARCVWEGNARIALTVRDVGQGSTLPVGGEPVQLNTSSRFDVRKTLPVVEIELLRLEPTPMAGVPIEDYSATLVVKAAP